MQKYVKEKDAIIMSLKKEDSSTYEEGKDEGKRRRHKIKGET